MKDKGEPPGALTFTAGCRFNLTNFYTERRSLLHCPSILQAMFIALPSSTLSDRTRDDGVRSEERNQLQLTFYES